MAQMTKQDVLRSLEMDDFRKMTPVQESALANMAQKMPSNVLDEVLNEVPNLFSTARKILSVYMQQSERIFARDEERMRHFRNLCDCTLASLQNMENKADSPEERLKISGQMLEIVRLVDTANARQIQIEKRECERTDSVVKGVAVVGGTAVAIGLIYALCKAFSNGQKDAGADISSENDPRTIDLSRIKEPDWSSNW